MKAMGSLLAVTALLLTGCSSSEDSAESTTTNSFPADSTMAKIAAKGKLVVGTAYDTPLFSVKNPTTGEIEISLYGYIAAQAVFAGGLRRFNLT